MFQEEKTVFTLCALLAALFAMIPGGESAAAGEKEDKKRTVAAYINVAIACLLILRGTWPAIVLFFTFQWSTLITGILGAVGTGAVGFGLGYLFTMSGRKRKYRKNPVMKEAVAFCRTHHIVAVQCFPDRLRFFSALENPDYCRPHMHNEIVGTANASITYKLGWARPASWQAYDAPASYRGSLVFADRGYPKIPDLDVFAKALAGKLGGCRAVAHKESVQYDTVSREPGKRITTHNITILYEDRFVYNRHALRTTFPRQLRKPKATPAPKPKSKPAKEKSWE